MAMADGFRRERDPLGELDVPADAYYGVQTARAVENFPISGLRAPADLVVATILIKKAAAEANRRSAVSIAAVADAIVAAADEILGGALRDQFVVDVYQAGAGTSHNMNANEVLANRAGEILGEPQGTYTRVHPNDHVNMGQSTNDVYPDGDAARAAARRGAAGRGGRSARGAAWRARRRVRARAQDRAHASAGRGADHARPGIRRLRRVRRVAAPRTSRRRREQLHELNIGATAVGTGLNAGDDYRRLRRRTPGALHRICR